MWVLLLLPFPPPLLLWPPVLVVLPPLPPLLLLWFPLVLHVCPTSAYVRPLFPRSFTPTPALAVVVALICARLCARLCPCWSPLVGRSHFAFVRARSPSFVPTRLCSVSWSPLPGYARLHSFWLCSYSFSLTRSCPPGCADPRYLVTLVWPLSMLVHAHLGSFGL